MKFAFKKVTATKYVGPCGYSLIKCKNGEFAVLKDNAITKWGTGFQTVKSAESFISQHDYIHASSQYIPLSNDDIYFIYNMYGCDPLLSTPQPLNDRYSICHSWARNHRFDRFFDWNYPVIKLYKDGRVIEQFIDADTCIRELDTIVDNDIVANSVLRGSNYRTIQAGKSPRVFTQNLIRVKSSNVWAYGMEVKDSKNGVGDVYVQFKGKDGGGADVYRYFDVPITLWRKILSHPSKGHAVWKYLRNNFLYQKLTGDKKGKLPNAVN